MAHRSARNSELNASVRPTGNPGKSERKTEKRSKEWKYLKLTSVVLDGLHK